MVEPLSRARGVLVLNAVLRGRNERAVGAGVRGSQARRRRDRLRRDRPPPRRARTSRSATTCSPALLLARDEDGGTLTDREVRDELVTLLLAGHETTATGLAWTFDLVLHDARVRARAIEGDDRYLDAVVKESLRMRPVIPGVGRVVRERPFASAATRCRWASRSTRRSAPSTAAPTCTPTRARSRPSASSASGGRAGHLHVGARSAVGRAAAWARASRRPRCGSCWRGCSSARRWRRSTPRSAETQFRAITLAPKGGVRVRQDRAPRPRHRAGAAGDGADQRVPAA